MTFKNVEELRRAETAALPERQLARVLGYYAENDGGGGDFYWLRGASTTLPAPNLGTVFAPLAGGSQAHGRWIRLVNSHQLNVLWFGVKPLAFDDPAIATAADSVAEANLRRIHQAIESLPSVPGGSALSGRAHNVELYFPSLPFVRGAVDASTWIPNSQSTLYFISDTLRVTKNCTLAGDGLDRTRLAFVRGAAPDAQREKFVVDFEKWGIEGTTPSQGETFECHLRDMAIDGGGADNPGSSGVRMDGAQMSSISNVAVSDVGLRGIVASAYILHNLSISRVARGPGLEVTDQGSDFGFVCASHLFVGFVNVEETPAGFVAGPHKDKSPAGIGDGDYWPAVQLNRCEHFTCADLRVERAPIALKVGLCGHVLINHLSASAPTATKGLSAIKLKNPKDGSYVGSVTLHGIDVTGYDHALWDNAASPDASRTPSNMRYAALSSFHRDSNGVHSGVAKFQGQGPEAPLQIYAHENANASGEWLCELYDRPLTAKAGAKEPVFRVRNDGLIQSRGGVVPVATQPLRITASP
ncbi:MAG: hypothetical protein ACOYMN_25410, partial [Roseimicrobium sp.]